MRCHMQTTILKPSQKLKAKNQKPKPKPKAKSQKPKAKSQKPKAKSKSKILAPKCNKKHANQRFWLQNAANSKENCPRLKKQKKSFKKKYTKNIYPPFKKVTYIMLLLIMIGSNPNTSF